MSQTAVGPPERPTLADHLWHLFLQLRRRDKQTHSRQHTPMVKGSLWTDRNIPATPLYPTHSSPLLLQCHLASHVCCHYTPLSLLGKGGRKRWDGCRRGHGDRFKQRASEKKHNRQLCIWRVKYAKEGGEFGWDGVGVPPPLCDPLFNPLKDTSVCTHFLPRGNRWEDVIAEGRRASSPLFSLLSPSVQRTAGRQTFLLLSFQKKTKECVGPLLHTRACVHAYTHIQTQKKTVNATEGWSYFSGLILPASTDTYVRASAAEPGTFVEGESQGDNPGPAYQSWHADVLVGPEPLVRGQRKSVQKL